MRIAIWPIFSLLALACLLVCGLAASRSAAEPPPAAARLAPAAVAPAPASAPAVVTSPEGCLIEKFDVPSPSMKRQIHAVVVLPPEYKDHPDKRYPILYTLHGARAPYATYSEMSPLRRALRDRPMIVTCFDGDPVGMYVDSPVKADSQFETFFFQEFVPYIDAHYRTNGQRGVEGFSMGGFGAFQYMLCKPEMFCSVSAMSGAFRMGGGPARRGPGGGLLGDPNTNKKARVRMDILARIEKAVKAGTRLPPMLIHCGTEDGLIEGNRQLAKALVEHNKSIAEQVAKDPAVASETDPAKKAKAQAGLLAARKINFHYMESPGAHNWAFWRDGSEIVIDFHWRSFRDAPAKAGTK